MQVSPDEVKARRRQLKSKLNDLARHVGPLDATERQLRKATDGIAQLLRLRSRFPIDRVIPGGSYSKRTANANTVDLDMVGFVAADIKDGFEFFSKRFGQILDEWEMILRSDGRVTGLTRKLALTFLFEGVDVDLLAGPAFEQDAFENASLIVKVINGVPTHDQRTIPHFSVGLTEASMEFFRGLDERAKAKCRLAKLWQQRQVIDVCCDGETPLHLSGRSMIFECLALEAFRSKRDDDILEQFKEFLKLVMNMHNIRVTFPEWWEKFAWNPMPPCMANKAMRGVFSPCNPNENLYLNTPGQIRACFFEKIGKKAKETLELLERVDDARTHFSVDKCLDDVFGPQWREVYRR